MTKSKFTGGLLGYVGISIASFLLMVFTLFLGTPWAVTMKQRWMARHTYIDGKQLVFKGSAIGLIGSFIKWFILTILTLGIYGFWVFLKMKNWIASNTHFAE